MKLLLIDNYDSFTWNLVHYLGELGAETTVIRNDDMTAEEALAQGMDAIVLSPGPATPDDAGICLDVVRKAPDDLPILGVCLGHQTIGQACGGTVVRAGAIMHGKLSDVEHDGSGVFRGQNEPVRVTRYHSLAVERASLPDSLEANAWTEDGEIMGLRHKTRPVHGVQFHPESIASDRGKDLLSAFLKIVEDA